MLCRKNNDGCLILRYIVLVEEHPAHRLRQRPVLNKDLGLRRASIICYFFLFILLIAFSRRRQRRRISSRKPYTSVLKRTVDSSARSDSDRTNTRRSYKCMLCTSAGVRNTRHETFFIYRVSPLSMMFIRFPPPRPLM